jgi:hypothetical protein
MTSRYMKAEFAGRRDRVSVQFSESGHEFHRIRRLLAYLSKFAENKIRLWLFSLMPAPLEAHRVSFARNKSEKYHLPYMAVEQESETQHEGL